MAAGVGTTVFESDLAGDGFGNDQINDIFGDDDDLFNAPAPLPPLSPTGVDDGANNLDGAGEEQDNKEKKKKRIIKRSPRPRLNEARLCGERGITALAHLCDGVKFKGKGHEASDLRVLLQRFEHWAHRLYPMYPFEDVVDQVETLGKKKLVQNAIKQARREDDGQVNENLSEDDEMQVNGQDSETNITSTPSMDNAIFGGHVEASSTPVIGLTPEQKERIRLNRERALAKRRAQSSQLASSTSQNSSQDNSNAMNAQDSLAGGSQNNREETEHIPSENSPERSKLNFETDFEETGTKEVENVDVLRDTMESETTGNKESMETGITSDKETMQTEILPEKETMETKITGDKETMETEVTGDKATMGTEITGGKETMETKITGDKETMETEVTGDKETMETEITGGKKTMETKITGDKETMETEVTGDKETMETKTTGDKETMETEFTGDKKNRGNKNQQGSHGN
ncbi:uncharacterized protein LOC116301434 isoform X2 [Actinia tenebrosa]|uniref:TIMELESS-interacting protein n=1 Tax=Actinia tenebrosa TaxID=6105 RepID=A0A6P8II39_ACTTE|nr:uncharacterized protein LOC116301434 isoform X2 [Actinia tenebrosa]